MAFKKDKHEKQVNQEFILLLKATMLISNKLEELIQEVRSLNKIVSGPSQEEIH